MYRRLGWRYSKYPRHTTTVEAVRERLAHLPLTREAIVEMAGQVCTLIEREPGLQPEMTAVVPIVYWRDRADERPSLYLVYVQLVRAYLRQHFSAQDLDCAGIGVTVACGGIAERLMRANLFSRQELYVLLCERSVQLEEFGPSLLVNYQPEP